MDKVAQILEQSKQESEKYLSIDVNKTLDLEYDIGTLYAYDKNELDSERLSNSLNEYLKELTRDNVQLLINKVWNLPTEQQGDVIVAKLPEPTFVLPRSKPCPEPRPLTKWEEYAKLKGIKKTKKKGKTWDEQLKKWIPAYGFKRAEAEREKDWVLEVPGNADPMEDQFAKKAHNKNERISKNEIQRMRNIAKSKNVKVPKVGIPNPDVATSKDLQAAITVARSSTASLGKFQAKLPREKEARGVSDLMPTVSRKRKMPSVSLEQEHKNNIDIIDSVLNKRPKLNLEKVVAKHIHSAPITRSEHNGTIREKGKGKGNFKAKKPPAGKGQRKGKTSGGRKRR